MRNICQHGSSESQARAQHPSAKAKMERGEQRL